MESDIKFTFWITLVFTESVFGCINKSYSSVLLRWEERYNSGPYLTRALLAFSAFKLKKIMAVYSASTHQYFKY